MLTNKHWEFHSKKNEKPNENTISIQHFRKRQENDLMLLVTFVL